MVAALVCLQLRPDPATGKSSLSRHTCLREQQTQVRVAVKKGGGESVRGVDRLWSRVIMEKLGTGGGARSYSDFMRSLAAKYNNNE